MIVKEERKTITVVFPDGRDGRTFTLKVGCVLNSFSWLLLCCFKWEGWHLAFAQIEVAIVNMANDIV